MKKRGLPKEPPFRGFAKRSRRSFAACRSRYPIGSLIPVTTVKASAILLIFFRSLVDRPGPCLPLQNICACSMSSRESVSVNVSLGRFVMLTPPSSALDSRSAPYHIYPLGIIRKRRNFITIENRSHLSIVSCERFASKLYLRADPSCYPVSARTEPGLQGVSGPGGASAVAPPVTMRW